MRLVIDIPEDEYEKVISQVDRNDFPSIRIGRIIKAGTPLPKGHGRLIDAKRFEEDNQEFWERDFIHPKYEDRLCDLIDDAPTIIEADKEGEPE